MIALAPIRQPARQIPADDHLTRVVSASRLNTFHSCRLKFLILPLPYNLFWYK